jgi:membrane-bound serine protease (ClpP class)
MIATLVVLVLFGLLLVMLEAFVPGGILGTFGVLCVLSAVILVLISDEVAWSSSLRTSVALGIVGFSGLAVYIWLKHFAVTLFHRAFTLKTVITSPPATSPLAGREGVATTELRPLGRIRLDDGSRHEARLLNGTAPAGTAIRVLRSEPGNLVVTTVSG